LKVTVAPLKVALPVKLYDPRKLTVPPLKITLPCASRLEPASNVCVPPAKMRVAPGAT
jgi:hypothetical protein